MRQLALALFVLLALALAACPRGGRTVDVGDFGGASDDTRVGSGCTDDNREEDDQLSFVLAKTSKEGEKIEAISCPGDDDLVHVIAEGRAGAAVSWNVSEGDVRVDLLDREGKVVSLKGTRDLEERGEGTAVLQRAGVAGDFYLRVRNRSGTPVRYRMEIGGAAQAPPPPPSILATPVLSPTGAP